MSGDDSIKRVTAAFREAKEPYKDNRGEECVAKAHEILSDPSCPTYIRIKNLVLLGAAVEDWWEGVEYHRQADHLWHVSRRWRSIGESKPFEAALEKCRAAIDDLGELLDEEAEDEECA